MNEAGKTLEYSEHDLDSEDRLSEINVDQHLLDTWHCLAEVHRIEESNVLPLMESSVFTT